MAFGYVVNSLLLFFGALVLFSYTNVYAVADETLPFYSVLSRLGFGWLTWIYILLMVLAVLTSLAGLAYAGSVRFDKLFSFIGNAKVRKVVIIFFLLGLGAAAAAFGLKNIMSKGNTINGYLGIIILAIPAYTIVRSKLKK